MRALWLMPVVFAAGLAQTSTPVTREGPHWTRTWSGSVDAPPSGQLRVSAQGAVVVRGEARQAIAWTLQKNVRAASQEAAERLLARPPVKASEDGEWVVVSVEDLPHDVSTNLELKVPRGLRTTAVETRWGAVQAYALDGAVEATTAGGRVQMDQIGGRADIRTGGGEIQLGRIGGSVRCLSGGGSIRADSIAGEGSFETAGGEIIVKEAKGAVAASTAGGNIRVERAASSVTANSSGGLIDVLRADGLVKAETGSGCIRVGGAKGAVVQSAGGTIQLRGVSGPLRISTAWGNILAELPAGAAVEDSLLNTASGDVTVYIPSNLAVTVQALNLSSPRMGKIVSEFPEIRVRTEEIRRARQALAEGELNGGGPLLRISAAGGTIYLRRQK